MSETSRLASHDTNARTTIATRCNLLDFAVIKACRGGSLVLYIYLCELGARTATLGQHTL